MVYNVIRRDVVSVLSNERHALADLLISEYFSYITNKYPRVPSADGSVTGFWMAAAESEGVHVVKTEPFVEIVADSSGEQCYSVSVNYSIYVPDNMHANRDEVMQPGLYHLSKSSNERA